MSIKEQMLQAQALIKQKKFAEARAILEKVNHPKATEWLARIDKIAPKSAKAAGKTQTTQSSGSSNRNTMLIAGVVILTVVILVIVAVLVVPNFLNNNNSDPDAEQAATQVAENQDDTDRTDEATLDTATEVSDATEAIEETATEVSEATEAIEETATEANETIEIVMLPAVSSGVTIPFITDGFLVYADVPQDWQCNCNLSSGRLEQIDESRNQIDMQMMTSTANPDEHIGVPYSDILNAELDEDETIVSQETLNTNGRELLHAIITDEDGDQDHWYFVSDSDGQVLRFEISSRVDTPASLQDVVLLVAGTVEIDTPDIATEFASILLNTSFAYNQSLNRWRFPDFVNNSYEHNVELPADWAIEKNILGNAVAVKSGSSETSATAISVIPSIYYESETLSEIAVEINEGSEDTLVSTESLQSNGREVYVVTTTDSTGSETITYLVFDSDNDLIALIIQPQVPDKDSLHDDVLFMAGNAESEEIAHITRLIRVGLIEGDIADNGYISLQGLTP